MDWCAVSLSLQMRIQVSSSLFRCCYYYVLRWEIRSSGIHCSNKTAATTTKKFTLNQRRNETGFVWRCAKRKRAFGIWFFVLRIGCLYAASADSHSPSMAVGGVDSNTQRIMHVFVSFYSFAPLPLLVCPTTTNPPHDAFRCGHQLQFTSTHFILLLLLLLSLSLLSCAAGAHVARIHVLCFCFCIQIQIRIIE